MPSQSWTVKSDELNLKFWRRSLPPTDIERLNFLKQQQEEVTRYAVPGTVLGALPVFIPLIPSTILRVGAVAITIVPILQMKKPRHTEKRGSLAKISQTVSGKQDQISCHVVPKSAFLASSPFAISRLQKKLNLVSFLGSDIRGPERGAGRRWEEAV